MKRSWRVHWLSQAVVLAVAVLIVLIAWPASAVPPVVSPQQQRARLMFSDTFPGGSLDQAKWNPFITSRAVNGRPWTDPTASQAGRGVQVGCNYSAQYYLPGQVRVDQGLDLVASRQPTGGTCNDTQSPATFPWRSGAISTYSHFQFDGGYVEVTMKPPSGDGLWPAVWMLPGPGGTQGDDNEIDIQEGGFAPPGQAARTFAWHLVHDSSTWGGVVDTGATLAEGFHRYALSWVPGQSLTWYFDGKQVGQLTKSEAPIPDEPMELIVDLAVATPKAAGWHPPGDAQTPSPATLQVASVAVWTNPPS